MSMTRRTRRIAGDKSARSAGRNRTIDIMTSAVLATAIAAAAPAAAGVVGNFRTLPYQTNPQLDGITLTWFTIDDTPGTIVVLGPGLSGPRVIATQPELLPVLDYQAAGELSAGGEFPFAATAIFESPGVPARNHRHRAVLRGLESGATYDYWVFQGESFHSNTFDTAPPQDTDQTLRFIAIADSETLVRGRTRFREWARSTPQTPDSTGRPSGSGRGRDQYFLSETEGYQRNLARIKSRQPDMLIMAGDLVEGTGNEQQRRWDEFFRHNAGSYDDLLSGVPLVAAIGNNCIFNGTAAPGTNFNVNYARRQWSAYFDFPGNGSEAYRDLYHRTDYGPVTVLTLCSVGAMGKNDNVAPPVGQWISADFPQNLDTNRAWLTAYDAEYDDIPDFNIGTEQYDWAVKELAAARAEGRIIIANFHHTPYSRGVHGSSVTSTQSGEAMRVYSPLFRDYGVVAVLAGHSEVSEMSYVDLDHDGRGFFVWDVGAAGDGLRGVEDAEGFVNANIASWRQNPLNAEGEAWVPNPYHVWSADQSEPETWNGNQLLGGGKHYGFLEVDVEPLGGGEYRMSFQYWHTFPLNAGDAEFTVTGDELRPYRNRVVLEGTPDAMRPVATCDRLDLDGDGVIGGGDLGTLLADWGACSGACTSDIDASGSVDGGDLAALLKNWGQSCR